MSYVKNVRDSTLFNFTASNCWKLCRIVVWVLWTSGKCCTIALYHQRPWRFLVFLAVLLKYNFIECPININCARADRFVGKPNPFTVKLHLWATFLSRELHICFHAFLEIRIPFTAVCGLWWWLCVRYVGCINSSQGAVLDGPSPYVRAHIEYFKFLIAS